MLFLAVPTAFAIPPSTATWSDLSDAPVHIECTMDGTKPYCRSTGVIGTDVDTATSHFRDLDKYVDRMGAITAVTRLQPDVLHVVMDYPFPITDRDYVAKFTYRDDPDGSHVFAWSPVTDPQAPDDGSTVRLTWLDGEWRFQADGSNTRVTYVWEADPGGSLPDVGTVRKKAGYLALHDIAAACDTTILSP